MIYCVIPPELADELYDKLVAHYQNNSNVQVIIDRRTSDRRGDLARMRGTTEVSEEIKNRRQIRDRRRDRPGTFPEVNDGSTA